MTLNRFFAIRAAAAVALETRANVMKAMQNHVLGKACTSDCSAASAPALVVVSPWNGATLVEARHNRALLLPAHKSGVRGALSGLLCWLDAPRTTFGVWRRSRTRC